MPSNSNRRIRINPMNHYNQLLNLDIDEKLSPFQFHRIHLQLHSKIRPVIPMEVVMAAALLVKGSLRSISMPLWL